MSHHVFLAFLDKAHHSLAGLRARRFAQKREAFVEAFDLVFGFGEVLFKTLSQAVEIALPRPFWTALSSAASPRGEYP